MATRVGRELQRSVRGWGIEWLQIRDHNNCIFSFRWDGFAVRLIYPAINIYDQNLIDDLLERTYGMAGRGFITFIGVENPLPEVKEFLHRNFSSLKLTKIFETTFLKKSFPEITEDKMVKLIICDMYNRTRRLIDTSIYDDESYIDDPWMLRDDNIFPLTTPKAPFEMHNKSKDEDDDYRK